VLVQQRHVLLDGTEPNSRAWVTVDDEVHETVAHVAHLSRWQSIRESCTFMCDAVAASFGARTPSKKSTVSVPGGGVSSRGTASAAAETAATPTDSQRTRGDMLTATYAALLGAPLLRMQTVNRCPRGSGAGVCLHVGSLGGIPAGAPQTSDLRAGRRSVDPTHVTILDLVICHRP
jgi:hypothetical protein